MAQTLEEILMTATGKSYDIGYERGSVFMKDIMAVTDDAIQAILQAVDEIIGEDEVEDTDLSKSAKSRWGVRARNRVRAEQRANLMKFIEGSK